MGSPTEYRRRITVDHTRVLNEDLCGFPVLLVLSDPALRDQPHGGHVARSDGGDIHFVTADGGQRLAHELVTYDPASGELRVWIGLPRVSCGADTALFLRYGGSPVEPEADGVWDDEYRLVQHLDGVVEPDLELPHQNGFDTRDAITVEAWVHDDDGRAEALQPLVSGWAPLESLDTFSAYDAGQTDGLDCTGYYGAVFEGRHVYFCPIRSNVSRSSVHGHVLRYDTQGPFDDPRSWEAYDARGTDGLDTVCYYGGAFDGRYVIFVPRDDGKGYHSRVLRYDTHGDFRSPSSWQAHDADLPCSHQSAAFDGQFLYCCPGYENPPPGLSGEGDLSGRVLRIDTRAGFRDPSSYRVFDTRAVSEETVCFDGGAFDGRYVYFVPLTEGVALQYDTWGDFGDLQNWRAYDARPLGMGHNVGAVFDGTYLYYVAYGNSTVVRYDTRADFTADDSWETREVGNTGGLNTGGFDGGFFDGRYVYFMPFTRQVPAGENFHHCNFLRYDTRRVFSDPGGWTAHDASHTDGLKTVGYNGGAFDGRFFYAAPLHDGESEKFHGRVLRYDTLGDNGSFSLRYCDYGGLCAAVPGPSFLVNTTEGVVSVAAHRALSPGWHHLVGVYGHGNIKLFVDGALVGERSGSAPIQPDDQTISIGHLAKGAARFRGTVAQVRISSTARSDGWIKTTYRNLVNPAGFARLGEEELVG